MTQLKESTRNIQNCLFEANVYQEVYPVVDKLIWLRKVDREFDLDILHAWMNKPFVAEFWNMAWPKEKIAEYMDSVKKRTQFDGYIAYMDETPFAYVELYNPEFDVIGKHYDNNPSDIGIHILIGEEEYLKRFIIRLSLTLVRFTLHVHPEASRLIGEPDENNRQVLALMRYLGFEFIKKIQLPEKIANFSILDRESFLKAHG